MSGTLYLGGVMSVNRLETPVKHDARVLDRASKAPSTRRRLQTQTLVNPYFYLRPHEDDHRLRNVFTRTHENARKRIKRCHTPNARALSIWACNLCFSATR